MGDDLIVYPFGRGNDRAFPSTQQYIPGQWTSGGEYGLTIREHFAGLAMQAIVSSCGDNQDEAARRAVLFADALIAELAKPPSDKSVDAHGAETRG